ncbi:flagellin [Solirhodobacter olei]|uniref:flagellin N-terminal helical domain-containing protein n=1 Tax=Solirhodobacter olei TaxID=2493082 RepID=UPI000FD81F39|nr:flagellin [Solirhodobacter olei]
MSSILTNTSAMQALQTLQSINTNLTKTQNQISTGLKIQSAQDNASYFSISQSMKGDSAMYKQINDSLTMTGNALATAALGASSVNNLAQSFASQVAFAQGQGVDLAKVKDTLKSYVTQIKTAIQQATFNGVSLVNASATQNVVTGISRATGAFSVTTMSFNSVNLSAIGSALSSVAGTFTATGMTSSALSLALSNANTQLTAAITASTSIGVAQTQITAQQDFLGKLTNQIDTGVGAMVDANMQQEAAKLQSLQVQQQLATQSLSIANNAPQSILSLFR